MKQLTVSLLTLSLVFISLVAHSQSKVTGQVVDEGDRTALKNATVMLLQAQDSILVDFVRADDNGNFSLGKPDTTDLLLVVTYPKFGDYVQYINKDQKDVQMGDVGLTSVAHLIEEVMITGRIPVVIKGDTVEYDAGSYAVEKNAKVEDLLKVLPGITVDADGKITAQGKTVEKVLVDGEEFFGDDPTLVTRNIRSDMVDKVQVYEKRSDEAERTGVDDGERIQTINVTLKEDAKNGMFGKVEGAGGTDEFYLGKVAVNKFKGSQKIGAYGLFSNDGTVSLGWQDEERFGVGDGDNFQMTDDGGVMIFGGGDEFSNWNGRGRPQAINTGISFMDRWREGKQKLNMSYKYGRIENNEISSSESQQNLLDNNFNQSSFSNRHTENQRHRFNGRYDWDIDSLTTFTMKLSGSRGQRESNDSNGAETYEQGQMVNENERTQNSSGTMSNMTYDGLVTRKFRKEGRSLSVRLAGNISENDGDALLQSTTDIYRGGDLVNSVVIDQMKDINNTSNNLQTSITYTEPISTTWRSSLGYGYNNSRSHSINNSYNNDGNGVYNVFDEEFSNDFNFNTVRNFANLTVGYKTEKIDFNLTNNVRNDDMYQRNNHVNTDVQRAFLTYNPSMRFRYNFTKSKMVGLNYTHNNILPSLTQIQPLRQNTDPLNIVVGNENLTPARSNNYSVWYNSYELLKNMFTYANAGFTQTHNSIQQNIMIDDSGIRTIFYDNIADHTNNNGYLWAGMGSNVIKKYSIQGRYGVNGNLNSGYNFLNGELNQNLNYNYGFNLNLEKNTTKNIDFSWGISPGWRRLESSLQPEYNSSGFTLGSNLNFKVFLPGKIQLYGDGRYTYEAPTEVFNEKFERLIFTPGISKRFLQNESLQVDLYVNDVFNQNVGFSRYQSAGMITQQNYNTISRYFMFKVSWDFTSMGGSSD